jgi:hypothetical protein
MRPRNPALRAKYRNAVASLAALGIPITLQSVADKAGVRLVSARNFFYRNPVLAKELGLATREHKTPLEYLEAALALDREGKKIDGRTLGKKLGRDHSAVYRFLRAHPGIVAKIYEATGVLVGWTEVPVGVKPRSNIAHLTQSP